MYNIDVPSGKGLPHCFGSSKLVNMHIEALLASFHPKANKDIKQILLPNHTLKYNEHLCNLTGKR